MALILATPIGILDGRIGRPGGYRCACLWSFAIGVGIGAVSRLLGSAGGELIIPALVFTFGVDIKLAGTAGVLISLPTVAVGLWRYAAKGAYADRRDFSALALPMGIGAILGAQTPPGGGQLLPKRSVLCHNVADGRQPLPVFAII